MGLARFNQISILAVAASSLCLFGGGAAFAASCAQVTPALTQLSTDFKEKAAELLLANGDIAARVASIVSTDTSNSASVLRLGKVATSEQKQAIGQGVAKAAVACQTAAPLETFAIQSQVIAANDQEILLAFLKGMSDITTTLAGTGGAAAGATGGSGTGVSNGALGRRVTATDPTGGGTSSSITVSALVQRSSGTTRSFTVGDSQLQASAARSP